MESLLYAVALLPATIPVWLTRRSRSLTSGQIVAAGLLISLLAGLLAFVLAALAVFFNDSHRSDAFLLGATSAVIAIGLASTASMCLRRRASAIGTERA